MTDTQSHPEITVYWRPRCGFCMMLRRALAKAGVATTEVDIWSDDIGAGIVRQAAGGNETVPTVHVGGRYLVNPSLGEVLAAAGIDAPERSSLRHR